MAKKRKKSQALRWINANLQSLKSRIKDSYATESDTYGLEWPRQVSKRHLCSHNAAASANFAQKEPGKSI